MKKLFSFLFIVGLFSTSTVFAAKPSVATPADSLSEYVGTYELKDGSYFAAYIITLKDGVLYGEADSFGANKLIKQKETDKFLSTSSYGSIITFARNAESKKVTGLVISLQGTSLEAIKKKE